MTYHLVVPPMGGTEELRVLEWHKTEGEPVAEDELLVELETEKAVVEVRAPRACVLRKILVDRGNWALIGPPVAWFSDSADEALQTEIPADLSPHWFVI